MLGNKKGLLLAGLAAYAYYRYTKMSAEEKEKLVGGIKQKGQKLYDDYVPDEIKNIFRKNQEPSTGPAYSEGDTYTV